MRGMEALDLPHAHRGAKIRGAAFDGGTEETEETEGGAAQRVRAGVRRTKCVDMM